MNFKVSLAKTASETTSASQHPDHKVRFIKTFLHMWDGSAHLSNDRKKNREIRLGTRSTWKYRERWGGGAESKTFHLPCFFRCADGTVKHQQDELLLRGKKGAGREQCCQMSVS